MGIIKREEGKEASKMQQTLLTLTNLALATAASLDLKQVAVPRLRAASGDANENEAFQQRLQCWDRTGQNGDSVIATDYMPYISYHNRAQSIIVTGDQWWTIYEFANYEGYKACLAPGQDNLPAFYSTMGSLHSLANDISSVAVGCYAKDKFYPDSMNVTSRSANGASGFFGAR